MTLELILYLFQNRSRMATQGKSEEKNLPVVLPQGENLEGMASRSGIPTTTEDRTGRKGRRSRSQNQDVRRRRSRSRTDSSGASTVLPTSQSEEDSTETDTAVSKKGGRSKRKAPKMYNVLKLHEDIMKELTTAIRRLEADNQNLRTENHRIVDMTNSLSNTTLKTAIEEERRIEHQPLDTEEFKAPKLTNTDCQAKAFNKALLAFHSSFRMMANGKDSNTVQELYQLVSTAAQSNNFSRRQFYQMFRSRVVLDSPLGEFVRESIRKGTSMRKFARGLRIYFGQGETYLSALERYQDFTGRNLSAKEFLIQLRSVSAGLVKNQPGDPSDPEADEQALLSHMREKLFTIMPTLAETILNRERSGRAPADSYEFGELLERYQLSIETHLRSLRSQANHRWHQNPVDDRAKMHN